MLPDLGEMPHKHNTYMYLQSTVYTRIYGSMAKKLISLRIDPGLHDWYRNRGAGYQNEMEQALFTYKRGNAQELATMPTDLDDYAKNNPCAVCGGKGVKKVGKGKKAIQTPCSSCHGSGGQSWELVGQVNPNFGKPGQPFIVSVGQDDAENVEDAPGAAGEKTDDVFAGTSPFCTVRDARTGSIRLERSSQPLYDTQRQGSIYDKPMTARESYRGAPDPIVFFATPNGRSAAQTNLGTAGQLSWPKRFHVRAVRLRFSHICDLSEASVMLQVGEKLYLSIPVKNMDQEPNDEHTSKNHELPPLRFIHRLAIPVYIPPVQYFGLTLITGSKHLGDVVVRAQLDGLMLREIA